MADLAGTVNAQFITVIPTAVALARGVRVALNASGLVAVADATVRGDFVTDTAAAASEPCAAVALQAGSIVAALASEAVVIGDTAYSAASGLFSKTSTNAILCGKWIQDAASGALGRVLCENPL